MSTSATTWWSAFTTVPPYNTNILVCILGSTGPCYVIAQLNQRAELLGQAHLDEQRLRIDTRSCAQQAPGKQRGYTHLFVWRPASAQPLHAELGNKTYHHMVSHINLSQAGCCACGGLNGLSCSVVLQVPSESAQSIR